MTNLLEPPEDWEYIRSSLMSNSDHEVDAEIQGRMVNEKIIAPYPGWNFHAVCWFDGERFHAAISRYGNHVDTFSAEAPEQLMELVSETYGYE